MTDPDTAGTDCFHVYERSSAQEPDLRYQGEVALVWTAAYEGEHDILGPVSGEIDAPLATEFTIGVGEVQAVITDGHIN